MEIWIGRDGERHGPYTEDEVRQWLRSGQVSGQDLGWYEGLADWQPLSVLLPDAQRDPAAAAPTSTATPVWTQAATTVSLEDYAGFWKRVAAYILDFIVLYFPSMLIQSMLGGAAAKATLQQAMLSAGGNVHVVMAAYGQFYAAMWPAMVLSGLVGWIYFAALESSPWQATIGKLALGIRVTDLRGQRISFPHALIRYLAKYLSAIILCIGFLMAGWTRRKQALHDLIVNTLVLNGRVSDLRKPTPAAESNSSFHA